MSRGEVAVWIMLSGGGTVTSLRTDDGHIVTPTAGLINIAGGNNLATTGTVGPNTVTLHLAGITRQFVQIGVASQSLTQLANGTTGQVLTAQTGADPIWAAASGTVTGLHTDDGNTVTPTAGIINLSGAHGFKRDRNSRP